MLALVALFGLLVTALATESVDASTFWLLTLGIAAGYVLSRGFAKARTASRSWDPREDL